MVLVTLNHSPSSIDYGRLPICVVGGVAHPSHVSEPVSLEVTFVDDPKTKFVCEVQEQGARWVVRGSNGVYVAALHERQLIANRLLRHRPPEKRVMLVPVYAPQLCGHSVDAKHRIHDFNGSEAEPHLDGFAFDRIGR